MIKRFTRLRRGLTLLELLVVLVILTIVATIAVSSLTPRIEAERLDKTQQAIAAVEEATIGPTQARQVDGMPLITGFVADIGRLPLETRTNRGARAYLRSRVAQADSILDLNCPLRELYDRECELAVQFPFRFRSGPSSPKDFSDVQLPCGWRGPYLQLPGDLDKGVVDGWGRTLDVVLDKRNEITQVLTQPNASLSEAIIGDLSGGRVAVSGVLNSDNPLPPEIEVVMLIPDPAASTGELTLLKDQNDNNESFLFEGVPVGLRAICVLVGDRRVITRYMQVPHQGLTLAIDLTDKLGGADE